MEWGPAPESERPLTFILEREGHVLASLADAQPSCGGLTPGHYLIKLDTGRVIWEGSFTERALVWSKARPGRSLTVTAQTETPTEIPSFEVDLLQGELLLRVYPGIESGRLEVTRQDRRIE